MTAIVQVPNTVPRLRDVAIASGVSMSTASRALNGDTRVRAATRSKVERAARSLNYQVDPMARALSTRRSATVGLLVHDIQDPFTAALATRLEEVLVPAGYVYLLVRMGDTSLQRRSAVDLLLYRRVDGLIVIAMCDADVPRVDIPVVAVGRHGLADVPYVGVDNVEGGRIAGRHLLRSGSLRPALLLASPQSYPVADRRTGFLDVMRAAGVEVREMCVEAPTYDPAYRGALQLVNEGVDGIFAISDLMGAAARAAATAHGLHVPEELNIVGYDDAPLASWPNVDLTSVGQETLQLSRSAMEILVTLIEDPDASVPSVVLRPRLIERGSTRQPLRRAGT